MGDGPPSFVQDFTCPALLRIPLARPSLHIRDYHPLWWHFPVLFYSIPPVTLSWSYNPTHAETSVVWARPRSIATTKGITIVFFSYGYLDVSVPHVCSMLTHSDRRLVLSGCPIRISVDQFVCANTHSFSQLITSFFAS